MSIRTFFHFAVHSSISMQGIVHLICKSLWTLTTKAVRKDRKTKRNILTTFRNCNDNLSEALCA